jgi:hypothetical protein
VTKKVVGVFVVVDTFIHPFFIGLMNKNFSHHQLRYLLSKQLFMAAGTVVNANS